jgi:hypothetical protein
MRRRRKLTVEAALHNGAWIQDISGALTVPIILQYLDARHYMDQIQLRSDEHDCISWHWTASEEYSSKSAYQAMLAGESSVVGVKELWKAKASNKCRFFIWSALLDRCWTTQRLLRHGLRSEDTCLLCSQDSETVDHLLCQCVFSRKFWFKLLRQAGWHLLLPTQVDTFIHAPGVQAGSKVSQDGV